MTRERVFDAFRRWGHLQASLDSLGRLEPVHHPELEVKSEAAELARRYYCGSIGVEFMHIPDPERCRWIAERMETEAPQPDRERILERLISAELLERTFQTRYIGAKRYSLEGSTALIPLLDEVLDAASERGAEMAVLAMSHRGRLNTLVHIMGKRPGDVFARFEDVDPRSVLGGGDVKYHVGATGEFAGRGGRQIRVSLVSNASHLEAVDPVAMGRARAKQDRFGRATSGNAVSGKVVPVTMHGDAAFAGQGIVAEVLNMADLRGYTVGGTIHIIVNNLIGFTTEPPSLHSSRYSTDVAKRLPIPIFHVNGEDPDAVIRVGQIAADYRYTFQSEVVIDLIGYRRHGHSEVDDPTATQPRLYKLIETWPLLWESYAQRIGADRARIDSIVDRVKRHFDEEMKRAKSMRKPPLLRKFPAYWDTYHGGAYDASMEVDSGVPLERLRAVANSITSVPETFHLNPKVKKGLEQRRQMVDGKHRVDWGMAEALAFGTLVTEGIRVRMSGQDSRRGTFNHRHSVLVDIENEQEYVPLANLDAHQAPFEIFDSPLSEAAPLGFEFGYSRDYPDALVLWEAQFGDFVNNAQVIIDQFVAATEDKWGLLSGLVMLLPHGYEGQGPEHSSARLERFLQVAGEDNMQVCQPSTSGQYFHMLRRQALRHWRKPLIVMTPKSLLRYPPACSPLDIFTQPRFRNVLPDEEFTSADRVLICSGKIVHELRHERQRRHDQKTAIVTVEQLYPFPEKELADTIERYRHARELVWVQEEPANMGALFFVRPYLEHIRGRRQLRTVKRSASASPATGSAKAHGIEQHALLEHAFARHEARSGAAD